MTITSSILLTYFACITYLYVVGMPARRFGSCTVYTPASNLTWTNCQDADCIEFKGSLYCLQLQCPEFSDLECAPNDVIYSGKCPRCRGTCVYGDEIYPVGPEIIEALDNVNHCICTNSGVICTKQKVQNPYQFCDQ